MSTSFERLVSRIDPLAAVAGALVVLQAVVRGWVVTGSYYFQDDFAHLDLARRLGLTPQYLVRDYGGHMEVGQYAVIWLFSHLVDGSFAPAAFSILAMQAIASVLLFHLLRTLFGRSPLILLPWTVYLFTPLSLAWSSWWSAALQTLPLQIATILVLLATTQAYRKRSRRWAIGSVVAFAGGLLMWEKAGLILPLALAVHLLVVTSPAPWRERLLTLRQTAWMWLAHAVVLGAYVVVYLSVVEEGLEAAGDEPVAVGGLLDQALMRMFVPGLFGGPWHADGAESTVYPYTDTFPAMVFLLLLLSLVVLSFLTTGRRAAEGWLLLGGYLTADLTLLALGRADWVGLLARDPRYVADALPVMTVAVLAAFRGLLGPSGPDLPAAVWLRPRMTRPVVLRGVVLLVVSCLVTTVRLAPAVQHEYAANYTLGVARQMTEESQRSVVNGMPPYEISARADLAAMMNAIGQDVRFDRPAQQMYLFDGLAQLRPMDLFPGSEVVRGPVADCGWRVGDDPRGLGEIEAGDAGTRILRLGYLAREPADLEVTVAERSQSLRVGAGLGRAFFVVGPEAGRVTAAITDTDAICVTDLAVGAAWVADPASVPAG